MSYIGTKYFLFRIMPCTHPGPVMYYLLSHTLYYTIPCLSSTLYYAMSYVLCPIPCPMSHTKPYTHYVLSCRPCPLSPSLSLSLTVCVTGL